MILLAYDGTIKIDTKLDKSGIESDLAGLAGSIGKSMVAIGAAAAAGLGAAVKAGIDFESAFAGVRKTVDATDAQLAALESGIRQLSNVMPTSAVEIAGVAEAAGQLGIETDNILAFTETMVMLGDATNMTAETAATTLARFANITGMSQQNFDQLGATIVALGNNFATTEAEIADMALNIASAGTQVGMSEAQIMGFATALSSVGMEADAGGTAISKLMIDMQLATETGGKALEQFANVAGMSAAQFTQAFQEDAASAISAFLTGLSDTERLGRNAISVLDEMGISEVRLRDTILRAANSGDLFAEALQTGTAAWEENTALVNEASQRYETLESKLGMLKNAFVNVGISIYQSLEEPLKNATQGLSEMVQNLQTALIEGGFTGFVNQLGITIAQIAANIAEQLPSLVNTATTLIQSLIEGISSNLPALVNAAANIVTSLVQGVVSLLPSVLELGIDIAVNLITGMQQAIPNIVAAIPNVITAICETLLSGLPELILAGVSLIGSLAVGLVSAIPDLVACIPDIITSFTENLSSFLPEIIDLGIDIITQLAVGIVAAIPELVAALPEIIAAIVGGIMDLAGGLWEAGLAIIEGLTAGVWESADALLQAVFDTIAAAIENAWNAITSVPEVGREIVSGIADGVASTAQSLWTSASNVINGAISAAKTAVTGVVDIGRSIVSGIANGVISAAQSLYNAAKNVVMNAINAAKSALNINSPSRVTRDEIGKPIMEGIGAALTGGAAGLASSLTASVGGAIDAAKKALQIHSPSRVAYDELGKPLIDGVAAAITDNEYEVSDAFKSALADLDLLRDYDIISEDEYYKRLEALRDEHIKAGTEDWHKYTLELVKYDKEQAEEEFEIAESKYEKGLYNEKQYYAELTRIRDTYFQQNTNAWNEFNNMLLEEVLERYNDHIAELKESITDSFQEIADEAISSFEEIKSAEDALASRLKGYGYLTETHTYTGQGENGGDLVITRLADLSKQTEELEAYNDALLQIRERAGDDRAKSLFSLMRDMDISEASQLAALLLEASDEEFNRFVDAYNEREKRADEIANNLFQGDYADAANEVTNAWQTQLEESEAQLKEYFGEIPKDFFACGLESADQFGDGIMQKLGEVFEEVRLTVSSFMAGFSPQFAFGLGSAATTAGTIQTYSPTYQIYNPTGDANAAIQAAKRREQLDRLRGMGG